MPEQKRIKHNDDLIRVMSDQKHMKHILTQEHIDQMVRVEARYPISKLPVCGHCERLALWGDKGTAHCLHCGTVTLKAVPLSEYYAAGYDLDGATGEDRSQVRHEKNARKILLPDRLRV